MNADVRLITVNDSTANPAPLGLMGFGMTTVLLNIHNAGFFPLDVMIMAMGIFYGGLAQLFAGVMEWKKSNTFGTTAFLSYGLFWLSLVAIWVMPGMSLGTSATQFSIGLYLLMWGVFTAFMFIGTLKSDFAHQFVFGSLVILFFMLAISDFTGSKTLKIIAGYEGIICGLSAIYTAMAQVLNEKFGRRILPLG